MTTWADTADAWATTLQAAGRSPRTIRLYLCHLRKIERLVPAGPTHATTTDLRRILATDGWAPETRKSVRSALVGFFNWAHAEGLTATNPASRLDRVSVPAGVPRPAPEEIVTQAIDAAAPRVRAMIMLGAYAGLRCIEIAAVHSRNWDGGGIYVIGKGGRERHVPVVREDLRAMLNQADGFLFPGRIDGHLSAGYVGKLIARALPDGWTAHTLRHRCATRMFAGTHDLLSVGAVLGHARPETTQRYVRLPDDSLRRAVAAAA